MMTWFVLLLLVFHSISPTTVIGYHHHSTNYSKNDFEKLLDEKVQSYEKEVNMVKGHKPTFTIFFPYYNQPEALQFQLAHYTTFPSHLKDRMQILIVDDGSQKQKAVDYITSEHLKSLNISLYRINIDIFWNTVETNNVAFSYSDTDYLLRFDADCFIDQENLQALLRQHDKYYAYVLKFKIDQVTQESAFSEFPHPGVFFLPKSIYQFYRFNEYFSGGYGFDDKDFTDLLIRKKRVKVAEAFFWIQNNKYSTSGVNRQNLTINFAKSLDPNRPFFVNVHREYYIPQILHSKIIV